jgi:hypothetical protein
MITFASIGLGLVFSAVVPPGQPADEESHFRTVQYYAKHASMPVLGEAGVTYEGQQGPIYYAGAALVERASQLFFDEKGSFYTIRAIGVLLLWPLVVLTYAISRQLVPEKPRLALLSAAFVSLHPSILAIAGSVQNDLLAIDLSVLALLLLIGALHQPTLLLHSAAAVGLVSALAILTKASAFFLIPTAMVAIFLCAKRRRAAWHVVFIATFLSGAGWFFARNVWLYGDLTGENGVVRAGVSFPPDMFTGINSIVQWFRVIASHFTIPYEYYWHVAWAHPFEPSVTVRAAIVLAAMIPVLGLIHVLYTRGKWLSSWVIASSDLHVAILAVLTLTVGYTVIDWSFRSLSPRMLFPLFPFFALLVTVGLGETRRWATPAIPAVAYEALSVFVLVVVDVYVLVQVAGIPNQPYWLFPRGPDTTAAVRPGDAALRASN